MTETIKGGQLKISQIRTDELDDSLCALWRRFQETNPSLRNPFFSLEFLQAVATVRDDVFVAVLEVEGCVRGFFPFQRSSRAIATPVGGRLSDYHGLIADQRFSCDLEDVLRACGLKIWDFDHVPGEQLTFHPHASSYGESPIMDLRSGFQAYREERKAAGSRRLSQLQRKSNKFAREIGELRFEPISNERAQFDLLIKWKRDQCRRTGVPDFLSWGWTTDLLTLIWKTRSPDFSGMLSVLSSRDDIIALHFGMRSPTVVHWWFPSYNDLYASYSPGGILLMTLAQAMATAGFDEIDLGKGDDAYKKAFASSAVPLLEGSVMVPSLVTAARRTRRAVDTVLRTSPMLDPLRRLYKRLRTVVYRPGCIA